MVTGNTGRQIVGSGCAPAEGDGITLSPVLPVWLVRIEFAVGIPRLDGPGVHIRLPHHNVTATLPGHGGWYLRRQARRMWVRHTRDWRLS